MEFKNLTISQIKDYFSKGGDIEDFYRKYIPWLKEQDKEIHGFLSFTEEFALETVKKLKSNLISNPSSLASLPLWGIPVAIKDNIMIAGEKCTAGSKILENFIAPYSATIIKKLLEAGAVIVGKTNMDEFAMGSSTENSAFHPTLNPYDKTRVPGGSSGGSAAVVGAGLVPVAIGSDTGGSIRQPAGFCNVYGLKPSYGAVSRYGLIAMASSLDQIGPIARNLEDLMLVYNAIKGKDEKDSTSLNLKSQNYNLKIKTQNAENLVFGAENDLSFSASKFNKRDMIVGIPKEFFGGLDEKIKDLIFDAIKKANLKTKEISLPSLPYSLACYYLIMPAEVSANLARFDGIRYDSNRRLTRTLTRTDADNFPRESTSSQHGSALWDIYLKSRKQGFGKEVQRRIILGTFILSHGYYEAYYEKAQNLRRKIFDDFQKAFREVDLIVSPVSPTLPFKLGEKTVDPLQMYLSDIYTVPVNLAYLPGLTAPVGFIDNLPVGLQIIGNLFEEEKIFASANFLA